MTSKRVVLVPDAAFRVDRSPSLCSAGRSDGAERFDGDVLGLCAPRMPARARLRVNLGGNELFWPYTGVPGRPVRRSVGSRGLSGPSTDACAAGTPNEPRTWPQRTAATIRTSLVALFAIPCL